MTDPQVIVIEDDPATIIIDDDDDEDEDEVYEISKDNFFVRSSAKVFDQLPNACQRRNQQQFYCSICMEWIPTTNCFTIDPCLHKFCISCMNLYIKAKVEDSVVSVGCPDPSCKTGILEPELCKNILPDAVFDRWGLRLCEAALGSSKFYCPYKDCSALLLDEGKMVKNSQCPHCRRRICATCKVPWHKGISCEEFEKGRGDLLLRELVADREWKRCPHCKMFVEKTEGCSTMQCRCQRYFCYNCGCSMNLSRGHKCRKTLH